MNWDIFGKTITFSKKRKNSISTFVQLEWRHCHWIVSHRCFTLDYTWSWWSISRRLVCSLSIGVCSNNRLIFWEIYSIEKICNKWNCCIVHRCSHYAPTRYWTFRTFVFLADFSSLSFWYASIDNWTYRPIVDWKDLSKNFPWGTLILLGAGLSIAHAAKVS